MVAKGLVKAEEFPQFEAFQRGGIVGRATILGVIRPGDDSSARVWVEEMPGLDLRWWDREQFSFVLSDAEPLPITPCKGRLSLFEVDESTLRSA